MDDQIIAGISLIVFILSVLAFPFSWFCQWCHRWVHDSKEEINNRFLMILMVVFGFKRRPNDLCYPYRHIKSGGISDGVGFAILFICIMTSLPWIIIRAYPVALAIVAFVFILHILRAGIRHARMLNDHVKDTNAHRE